MTEQNLIALRSGERALLLAQAKRGQLFEHAQRSKEALAIWLATLRESQAMVSEARIRLKAETSTTILVTNGTVKQGTGEGVEATGPSSTPRQRLRSALELEHMLLFFAANAYFQIKSDGKEAKPGSPEYQELERREEEYYEHAKIIRKEILVEARDRANSIMSVLRQKYENNSFVVIPNPKKPIQRAGIESRSVIGRLHNVTEVIDKQAHQINEWRVKTTKLLLVPLVDEEETDLQGDEYETSTQQQDTVYSYVDALRAIIADFHDIVTGQKNIRIDYEVKVALRQAEGGGGHSPELLKGLLGIRQELKPPAGTGSVRGIVTNLRELRTILRGQLEKGSVRAGAELGIINDFLDAIQSLLVTLGKAAVALEREVELFTDIMNVRLEYYRQLQQISDTVASPPSEEDLDEQAFMSALAEADRAEGRLRSNVNGLQSTARYLDHLRTEDCYKGVQRLCIICQQNVSTGILTSCGHAFCEDCMNLWRKSHKTCPTCKRALPNQKDLHQITYKPLELTAQEETQQEDLMEAIASDKSSQRIYTDISASTLDEIRSVDMNGKRSFGSKIDSIGRHIIWLREHDPGSKTIVFSQFRDFLTVLGTAFDNFKIGYANMDGKNGVERFKDDAGIECLLMHAKGSSTASGLTLVNATHVLLCEPLINTAIELQAIARVHRIGQHQATTVWVYVVENTVEQSVYEISVERRMGHIGRPGQTEAMGSQVQAADTSELEGAVLGKLLSGRSSGGEIVDKEDVWNCLFRHRPGRIQPISPRVEGEVGRHRRDEAAAEHGDRDEGT